jgi:hypothetical protein
MTSCACCGLTAEWESIAQPTGGFVINGSCEPLTIKYLKVAPGQTFACNQAVFYNASGLLTTVDTDLTKFAGFMVHDLLPISASQKQSKAPVYVAGTFDGPQAVFATQTWNDPLVLQALRDRDIFLDERR